MCSSQTCRHAMRHGWSIGAQTTVSFMSTPLQVYSEGLESYGNFNRETNNRNLAYDRRLLFTCHQKHVQLRMYNRHDSNTLKDFMHQLVRFWLWSRVSITSLT